MLHFVARAVPGRVLFDTWEEGLVLWTLVRSGIPRLRAACVMPDHVHLVHDVDVRARLSAAMRAYARMRNAALGLRGSLWMPQPEPAVVPDALHRRRTERYLALNPCRKRSLRVDCPLAWPLSTHRDALGLALDPWVPVQPDPAGWHRYVSGDPTASIGGTPFPIGCDLVRGPGALLDVAAAVRAVTRCPSAALHRRGPIRTLLVRACQALTDASTAEIADFAGMTRRAVQFAVVDRDPAVDTVARVLGDPRLQVLASTWSWRGLPAVGSAR